MSIALLAPHTIPQTATILPNPEHGDANAGMNTVQLKRANDGTTYTYVKKPGTRKLQYAFRLTRDKAEELDRFIRSYGDIKIRLIDHKGATWVVRFTNEVFDFRRVGKGEHSEITLEFEGSKI